MLTGKLSCQKPLIVTQPSSETIAVNPTASIKFFESNFASEMRLLSSLLKESLCALHHKNTPAQHTLVPTDSVFITVLNMPQAFL